MKCYSKETIERKLAKAGLSNGAIRGSRQLEVRFNGRAEDNQAYIVISNLNDPNDTYTDYCSAYFPSTIKAAIEWMGRFS